MARSKKGKSSIFVRLLLPLIVIVVLTIALLVGALNLGGAFGDLRSSALDMLEERTQSRAETLQFEMINRWSNLESTAETVGTVIRRQLRLAGVDAGAMKTNASLNAQIMLEVAPTLVSRLRAGGTTGIFVVLNGIGVAGQENSWAGVYMRDSAPTTNSEANSDILLVRGLPPVSRALDLSLDSYWTASCVFDEYNRDVFFKPLEAAQKGTSDDPTHYGFWCMPFQLNDKNPVKVMTYSMPILDKDGAVLAVIGADMDVNYLTSLMTADDFSREDQGSFVLGKRNADGSIDVACVAGISYKQYFQAEDTTVRGKKNLEGHCFTVEGSRNKREMYAAAIPLNLYSPNTAFEDDEWVLVGMQPAEKLMAFSEQFRHTVYVAVLAAIVFSVLVAALASGRMIRPITRLAKQVKEAEPGSELDLGATNIAEIDTLAEAIETMNRNALQEGERFESIMQMTGVRVGVFELNKQSGAVFCSPVFLELLDCSSVPNSNGRISLEVFRQLMVERFVDGVDDDIWRFQRRGQELYLSYKQVEREDVIVGTLVDVTEEIKTRKELMRARDIDALTGILNRRAFARMTQELFGRHRDTLKIAALVMVDLDNLKFLNTTYGHDTGDTFIRGFAHALAAFEKDDKSIVARRSGDEFYILLYGYDSKAELEEHIQQAWGQLCTQGILLPDGSFYRYRASGGMAWFPEDADTLSKLLRYADFAMYKVKQDAKGTLKEFDSNLFNEESYLIDARAALDRMIDNQLLHFAYQPIVSVKTAELWGYELLMRPDVPELKSAGAVLRLAKEQGKLHHIERLTWFGALESARMMIDREFLGRDVKLFINSIASQKMDLVERQHIIDSYSDLLSQVVMEITEGEDNNKGFTQRKMKFIRSNGGQVAIDDYGTGYNSELALVDIPCEYVKMDASFVRDVHRDTNKQALAKNLVNYAHARGIAVLAEGIETRDEMEAIISFGVDYLQGFYLGMPREKPQQVLPAVRAEIRGMTWKQQNT